MADSDSKITGTLEERYFWLGNKVDVLAQKVDDFIAESREMRHKHDEEMKTMREDMREMRENMKAINQRIDTTLNQMHNMTIAMWVGIGAIVVAVVSFVANK